MRFLDLFAGIGGFSLGLERAGMVCAGQVEIDGFCNRVLEKHWPHVKRLKDIREINGNEFTAVELICGGFPCQPFSSAGKQRGQEDDRYLWPEMLRIIQTIRPRWVCGENVVGIINMALDTVLAGLESLGYSVQALIIPACAVDAPHQRERVWIMACNIKSINAAPVKKVFSGAHTGPGGSFSCERWWKREPQPQLGRMVHGLSRRVDRLRALGNAVVPQVVEVIGRAILETESAFETGEAVNTGYNSRLLGSLNDGRSNIKTSTNGARCEQYRP
jgi:DNA (cytosine-5)-methyltransferase 1